MLFDNQKYLFSNLKNELNKYNKERYGTSV